MLVEPRKDGECAGDTGDGKHDLPRRAGPGVVGGELAVGRLFLGVAEGPGDDGSEPASQDHRNPSDPIR